jgi:hypothetical protein
MKRIPPVGVRCRLYWDDIRGGINIPLEEATPAKCWTEGIIAKKAKDYVVIATSKYEGEDVGDYTCIPLGVIRKVQRI